MFQDKFIFSQLSSFLDRNHFNYLVRKYSGNKYVKHFTCWDQALSPDVWTAMSSRKFARSHSRIGGSSYKVLSPLNGAEAYCQKYICHSQPNSRLLHLRGVRFLHDGLGMQEARCGHLQVQWQSIRLRINYDSALLIGILVGKVPQKERRR